MLTMKYNFDAQTDKIFKLMIHSLYENKEIFLRELISNASDACDKLRYKSITNPTLLENGDKDLKVTIFPNKDDNTLTITDNGIGMNSEDMQANLGTIAKSGTEEFAKSISEDKKGSESAADLIGQFGVGFYSAFMVADKVEVYSLKAGESQAYKWTSEEGQNNYTIEDAETDERGTTIVLHLNDDSKEYLDEWRIKHLVESYSNHVPFDIFLELKKEEGEGDDKKEFIDSEKINSGKAIWLKDKKDIDAEEYNKFYQSVGQMGADEPFMTLHNKVEGQIEYTNLLFVPSAKPFDLFQPDREHKVKLYIKRVFISEGNDNLIPPYLRFVRGVVDSEDLPLNISRETIQNSAVLAKIKSGISKRIFKELATKLKKDFDAYKGFWNNFGAVIKEGLCDGMEPRDDILNVCIFNSANNDEPITLAQYKENMKEGQDAIYYITSDDLAKAKASPQIERYKKDGVDVLLLTDSVDEFWASVLFEYQGTPLKSVTKADDAPTEDVKTTEEDNKLVAFFKDTLGEVVSDVKVSTKLTDSPVCLSASAGGMDIRMERFMMDNKQLGQASAKILEINPNHKIVQNIAADMKSDKAADTVHLLFAQAAIIEGEPVNDVPSFTSRLNKLIEDSLAA